MEKAIRISEHVRDEKVSYSKTYEEGDITKSINVQEVENGFVVRVSEHGYKGKGDKREWFDETKTYISTVNPLEEKEEKNYKEELMETLANLKL